MKIFSGYLHGTKLSVIKGENTRPTSALIREAVFNSLGDQVLDAHIADFFAGTGAMGLEALSRGAKKLTFLENDPEALKALQKNLTLAQERLTKQGVETEAHIIKTDFESFIKDLKLNNLYDIIWLDPPYNLTLAIAQAYLTQVMGMLKPDGVCIVEMLHKDYELFPIAQEFQVDSYKRYGNTGILKMRKLP
jgi:16S rRNA (guanine966-N2)-methyltransferase